ncbi:MAG: flavodoxin family protein [Pseudomonadota bacterium]
MSRILMVANKPSENTARLWDAARRGLIHPDVEGPGADCFEPLDATPQHLLEARAVLIGTTENFGYMSGLVKDFFERTYYTCEGQTEGMPYAVYIRAGRDGTGTVRAITGICQGMGWRPVQEPLLLHGEWRESFCEEVETLGMTLAAGVSAGLY